MTRRIPALLAAGALAAGTLTSVGLAAPAVAGCPEAGTVYVSTPDRGIRVWIPTSVYSDWVKGATIRRSVSEGSTTAQASSKQTSITVTGEVGAGWGPVSAKVTSTYNGTWKRSTARSTSYRSTWSYSFKAPSDTLYRARAYKQGWRYKFTQTTLDHVCHPTKVRRFAFAPVASNRGTYRWALEKYANRGKYRYDF